MSNIIKLPEPLTLEDIQEKIKDTEQNYTKVLERMRVLDGTDRGRMWEVIKAKFPHYQLTPDSNWINYIKENIVASIYTTGRYATLFPKSNDDIKYIEELNSVLETIWDNIRADYYQFLAGERAALLNIGITQVGWSKNIKGGTKNHWYKGDVVFKNIDPMKFRRDPYADIFDNAEFCYYFDEFPINFIKNDPQYKEVMTKLIKMYGPELDKTVNTSPTAATVTEKNKQRAKQYHRLTYFYIKYKDKVIEIHLLNDKHVLFVNENLKPAIFPFAILHCNDPAGDIVGASEPAKAFSNAVTYNLLNSIYATYAYKAQRPPRFVNTASGINIRQFAKYGNDADKTFPVNGDASKAVHYAQFPALPPELLQVKQGFAQDIQLTSGIDMMYAGKNTASLQTTGGMDSMLMQTTQRDNQKILLYEMYTTRLTELVIANYQTFGDKRKYTIKDDITQEIREVELNFPEIDEDIKHRYALNIQPYLPRNKQRTAQIATMLLEKQTQYKPDPEIITVEEWLLCQDLPMKDLIFKRMGIQRNIRISERIAETLEMFASLVEEGMNPEDAIDNVASYFQNQDVPNMLGNVAEGPMQPGAPQTLQAGLNEQDFNLDETTLT